MGLFGSPPNACTLFALFAILRAQTHDGEQRERNISRLTCRPKSAAQHVDDPSSHPTQCTGICLPITHREPYSESPTEDLVLSSSADDLELSICVY